MNSLGAIACGVGLQDGLNPCIFMTCAAFIVYGLWLKIYCCRMAWLRVIFVLVYILNTLFFNFGPAQIFILGRKFIFAAKIIYLLFSMGAFILGALFLKDWFLMSRGQSLNNFTSENKEPSIGIRLAAYMMAVVLGLVLSVLATLAPVNNYIFLLTYAAILKSQWQSVTPLMAGYILASMWPLWFVWVFISIKNLRPSLLKIFSAAIFFTASSCMIFMFK